jgi:hypothetical protein
MKTDTLSNPIVQKAIEALHRVTRKRGLYFLRRTPRCTTTGTLAVSRNSPGTRLATNDSPQSIASRMMD